jgi:hypothetical protein
VPLVTSTLGAFGTFMIKFELTVKSAPSLTRIAAVMMGPFCPSKVLLVMRTFMGL